MNSPTFVLPQILSLRPSTKISATSPRRVCYPYLSFRTMQPKATIAAPSDLTRTTPDSEENPSSLWMPLPGLVHDVTTPEQFDRLLQVATEHNALLVADFMARWCRKCLYLLPKLKKLGLEFSNVYYCSINVNAVNRLPRQFEITKLPTFIFFKKGERVGTIIGGAAPPKVASTLRTTIERHASSE